MITKTEYERIMLINTDITLRGYKYSKKKETDIHTDAHATEESTQACTHALY